MNCDRVRDCLVEVIEGCAEKDSDLLVKDHLEGCPSCREEMDQVLALRKALLSCASGVPAVDLTERVLRQIRARTPDRAQPSFLFSVWESARRVLEWRTVSLAAVGVLVAGIALVGWLAWFTPPSVWAIENSIEALGGFRGIYLSGVVDGHQNLELWIRTGTGLAGMQELLGRLGETTIRVSGNRTFYHQRGSDTVLVDEAQTAGFYPMPGPELLKFVQAAGFREISRPFDRLSGNRRIIIETSLTTSDGLVSAELEFDASTNLLVAIRQWHNLDRKGQPSLDAGTIAYFEELPDQVFSPGFPSDAVQRPRELEVPEELLGLLAGSQSGLSGLGLSEEEAARSVVSEMLRAAVEEDWSRFRQLVPVASGWSDQMLKAVCQGADGRSAVTEVLAIGDPVPRGSSRLGPLMVVPTRVKCRDGFVYEQKFSVQFRGTSAAYSCVVFASYGVPYRLG